MNEFESKQAEWDSIANASADFKEQVGRPFEDSAWLALSSDVLSKLELNSASKGNVLDVGCGNGLLLSKIANNFNELVGVDYSESMVDKAKMLLPDGAFTQSEANSLRFKNNYFDRVLCYSIFHYFPSYDYALEVILEMIRVTKPGGLILLGDILDANFESEIKGNSDLEYEKTIPLIHRYSQWRFYNFKKLIDDLAAYTTKVEVLTQPETFVLATYRKDIRIWV